LRDAREPRPTADERPHSFGWEREPDYSRTLRVAQVLRDGVVLAFDQADAASRLRTGMARPGIEPGTPRFSGSHNQRVQAPETA
jgi:hypothetical protein